MPSVHNFTAGPAALPLPVRERLGDMLRPAADGSPSLVELSHRGRQFLEVSERLHAGLREVFAVGNDYEILLMPGGAQMQFALLPMNLAAGAPVAYLESGHWSATAIAQARPVANVRVVGSSSAGGFTALPAIGEVPPDAAYLHYCGNETIHGMQFAAPPASAVPLLADLSSEILSRPYPFATLGGFYASAQKNLGIPGLTIVVLRRDLLARVPKTLPGTLSYATWSETKSMPNTPTTVAWVACLETLGWIAEQGGVDALAKRNAAKAQALYACLDRHDLYQTPVQRQARSSMNVVFRVHDATRERALLAAAAREGFIGLEGHRAVGGLRASLYNAIELSSVTALVEFLDEFARTS